MFHTKDGVVLLLLKKLPVLKNFDSVIWRVFFFFFFFLPLPLSVLQSSPRCVRMVEWLLMSWSFYHRSACLSRVHCSGKQKPK